MSAHNLCEFVKDHSAVLDILGSDDALFLCSLIAHNGYTQTAEFREELEGPSAQIRTTLERLVRVGLIAHQSRSGGIFNGWVITKSGTSLLRSLGLVTDADFEHVPFGGVDDEIEKALHAQQRRGHSGPSVQHVMQIVRSVPADRQEWLGFAICYEPIPDDVLDAMLNPSDDESRRLRSGTLDELDKIPTEEWKDWGAKHGIEKSVDKSSWARIQ